MSASSITRSGDRQLSDRMAVWEVTPARHSGRPALRYGARRSNQFDHSHAIDERSPAPSLCDAAEQTVLDLIPLQRARRIVMDVEHEARLVGELLMKTAGCVAGRQSSVA